MTGAEVFSLWMVFFAVAHAGGAVHYQGAARRLDDEELAGSLFQAADCHFMASVCALFLSLTGLRDGGWVQGMVEFVCWVLLAVFVINAHLSVWTYRHNRVVPA